MQKVSVLMEFEEKKFEGSYHKLSEGERASSANSHWLVGLPSCPPPTDLHKPQKPDGRFSREILSPHEAAGRKHLPSQCP